MHPSKIHPGFAAAILVLAGVLPAGGQSAPAPASPRGGSAGPEPLVEARERLEGAFPR